MTVKGVFTPEEVLWGFEMAFVSAGILISILVSSLLSTNLEWLIQEEKIASDITAFKINQSFLNEYKVLIRDNDDSDLFVLSVYGTVKEASAFLLPWMVAQITFVALLIFACFLVLFLATPNVKKLYALIPAVAAGVGIGLWSLVSKKPNLH